MKYAHGQLHVTVKAFMDDMRDHNYTHRSITEQLFDKKIIKWCYQCK